MPGPETGIRDWPKETKSGEKKRQGISFDKWSDFFAFFRFLRPYNPERCWPELFINA
jgi:hypothetical protein